MDAGRRDAGKEAGVAKSVLISEIVFGKRHRKDLGDVPALAASIESVGLLHPIVLRPDNTLIVGARRVAAFKYLGRDRIPATIAANLTELSACLRAEADENTCRKTFTPSEAVAMGEAIEKAYRPVAEAAQTAGKSHDGTAGGRGKKKNPRASCPKVSQDESARTTAVAAAAVGMTRKTYEKAKAVVASKDKAATKAMDATNKVDRAFKAIKRAEATAVATVPLPVGQFDLLLADPPWQYDFAETTNREIDNHYPTMSLPELQKLDPPAAKNCVLFLWATAPKLREAMALIDAWGFEYKTHAIWDKQKLGMGYWFRGRHELLLVATKGKCSPPDESLRQPSVFSYPRGKHSAKPAEVYAMLEAMFPTAQRCELFARKQRDGWTSWGNQL